MIAVALVAACIGTTVVGAESNAMTATQSGTHQSGRFARIVRRVTGVVEEMNYAQRRSVELFTGLDERR